MTKLTDRIFSDQGPIDALILLGGFAIGASREPEYATIGFDLLKLAFIALATWLTVLELKSAAKETDEHNK